MKRSVVVALTASMLSLVGATPALAGTIIDEVKDEVRARVCYEEYGYGVVDCSQEVDPVVREVMSHVPTQEILQVVGDTYDTANQTAQDLPGRIEETKHYVECWVLHPSSPEC